MSDEMIEAYSITITDLEIELNSSGIFDFFKRNRLKSQIREFEDKICKLRIGTGPVKKCSDCSEAPVIASIYEDHRCPHKIYCVKCGKTTLRHKVQDEAFACWERMNQ